MATRAGSMTAVAGSSVAVDNLEDLIREVPFPGENLFALAMDKTKRTMFKFSRSDLALRAISERVCHLFRGDHQGNFRCNQGARPAV